MKSVNHVILPLLVFTHLISSDEINDCRDPVFPVTFKEENKICRTSIYPECYEIRFEVPEDKIPWSVPFDEYKPTYFTMKLKRRVDMSDPKDINITLKHQPKWNAMDGLINRISYLGNYSVVNGFPLNPIGRTGLAGKGINHRWGPNHEVRFIITRWTLDGNNKTIVSRDSGLPQMEVLAVRPIPQWRYTLPKEEIKKGETVYDAVTRLFMKEILNVEKCPKDTDFVKLNRTIERFFRRGKEIRKGYSDHIVNTDNAWVETVTMHYHDQYSIEVALLKLKPKVTYGKVIWRGADRSACIWMKEDHADILKDIIIKSNAHW